MCKVGDKTQRFAQNEGFPSHSPQKKDRKGDNSPWAYVPFMHCFHHKQVAEKIEMIIEILFRWRTIPIPQTPRQQHSGCSSIFFHSKYIALLFTINVMIEDVSKTATCSFSIQQFVIALKIIVNLQNIPWPSLLPDNMVPDDHN